MSHWREPTIENANFEAFLFNVSPHAAMQTYPPVHVDFDAEMRELDDVSFLDLRPSDMFESLPMPKGYKAAHHAAAHHHDAGHHDQFLKLPNFNGAAHHHHHAEATPTKDFTSGFLFEPRDENMMLMPNFVSPRVMSFAQGFGLDSSKYVGHNDYHLGMTNPAGANASFQFDDTFSMSPLNNGKFLDFGNGHHDFLTVQLPPAMSGHFPVNNASSVPEPNVEIIEQVQYEENMISNSSSAPAIMSSFQESFVNDGSNIVLQSRASSDESASSSNSRPISEIASSCHHCKRRRHPNELKACHRGATGGKKAPGETSRRCCRKRYCVSCLQKYGISFADADEPGWTCMACRGACECAACRRKGSN